MRLLVCGSRTFSDDALLIRVLDGFKMAAADLVIIQGEAAGADRKARNWAIGSKVQFESYPADWQKDGKAAGPIRNQRMLDEGKPTSVLAFVDKPLAESFGTFDMVRRAKRAQVPVYVVEAM